MRIPDDGRAELDGLSSFLDVAGYSSLYSNPTERAVPVGVLQQHSVFSSSEQLEASDLQELL